VAGGHQSAHREFEALAAWRFHRQAIGDGARFESTAYIGGTVPLESHRAGMRTSPSVYTSVASGYASRSHYFWVGAGYQRYDDDRGDRQGKHEVLQRGVWVSAGSAAIGLPAVRVAVQRLPGVEAVDVSLERAVVDIRLRAGNAITLAQVRGIIKSNGFTSKDAAVTVVGILVERGGNAALEVSGTTVVMSIVADATSPDVFRQVQNLRTTTGRSVELTGTVISTTDQQEQIAVRSVR
jgi:hypothetical protein